ncbi:hypothetical protein R5R35_002325 [Gryllus longicercus]|uniref:Small subunit processome component 20 homolog n=1 Tax=Gryllus longicercus TaxID=2509291 RepID=A0AAN9VNF2_9ORTH
MKTKPTRHKETNTFRFQPFSERISHLDVDVFHRIGHKNEEYDEEETFLYQAIRKWNVLNLSEGYEELRKELPPVQTLPMLLHGRDLVIDVILKHLAKRNPLSLETILDLLSALIKDLRYEVYSSYGVILQRLCELLSTKNADELEWTFTCLAYMFKYLWRYIVRDVDTVFDSLVPLFSDSKPEYIRNFAAESFAYVVRKVRNKKDFVKLLLCTLESRPDGIEGCGRLMFEVVRGIRGRFHSFVQEFLPQVMDMLFDSSVNSVLLFDLLSHMFKAMCSFVEAKYFTLVWTTVFEVIFKHQKLENTSQSQLLNLKLVKQIINYKGGVLLVEPHFVITNFLKLLEDQENNEICMILSEILGTILMSPNVHLTQDVARRLTMKALTAPYEQSVLNFICQVIQYSGFETLILPWVQNYVCSEIHNELSSSSIDTTVSNKRVLDILSQIVLQKSAPCLGGISFENWKSYPLDLSISCNQGTIKDGVFESYFLRKCTNISSFKECDSEELISMFLVLPHVKMTQEEIVKSALKNLMVKLCSELHSCDTEVEEKLSNLIFLFLIVLEACIHILGFQDVENVCSTEFLCDVLLPLAKQPSFIGALHAVDLYITALKLEERNEMFRMQLLKKLHSFLSENLLSPYHKVRLLTSHIFSLFVSSDTDYELNFLKICLEAENVDVSVQNIREKLLLLDKLSFDVIGTNNDYLDIPLQYLLGVLYENFQLLWDPVAHLIASYARGMPVMKFWKVFDAQLKKAAKDVIENEVCKVNSCSFSSLALVEIHDNIHNLEDRPDFSNYRILLWKAFAEFPELCDMKSKDVSPLFLNFLEEEYLKMYSNDVQFSNVLLIQPGENQDVDTNLKEKIKSYKKANEKKTKRTQMYKALVAHMKVFAKIKSPRSIHKEPQLRDHYFYLLTSRNSNVQKLALDCLMAYKEKYLLPYSDHLYGLLNDKTFKSEITLFRVDKESTIIQKEHREKLLPVVLRILYGRMLTKTGHGSTGRGAADLRRSLVLRFLAGCYENEMIMFLQLAFKAYLPYVQDDAKTMVEKIMKDIELNHVIGLKSLRSSVNMVLVVIEKFGALMSNEVLTFVLRILICIGALISSILAHKTEIHPGYASGIRKLQSSAIMAAAKFFSHFTEYTWSPDDLVAALMVFVWHGLEKLPTEGIHSPTALLKLFLTWTRDPRYFHLLIKSEDGGSITPLGAIMNLLCAPKIKPSVTKAIMDLVAALLTTADFTEETSGEQEKEVLDASSKSEELNYGSKILLLHVPVIIQHLQNKLKIKKKKGLGSQELLILSRVCELESNAETSENLLRLLFLAFLKKVNGPEETVIHLVSTICTLWRNVNVPFQYLKCIAPLFGNISSVTARRMLCNTLTELAEKDNELNKDDLMSNVQLIIDINAWDRKWVEQPDYVQRLDGFKTVHQMVENEKIMLNFGVIIVYNCFYILKGEKDLSLKDAAGYCLRKLCPFLCKQAMLVKNNHVPETIIKLITAGIREKTNDSLHDKAIMLLGELVRECYETHPILLDLKGLACKEDPEVDFFHNMVHLQNHRRARALMKFCSVAKQMVKPPRTHTMTQIILPLVTSFLCSEKYARKRNVVDAATVSIGVVSNFLPWFHYEAVLRFYLNKLHTMPEFQKQLVRVVVSILDAFHFDVSLAEQISEDTKDKNFQSQEISVDVVNKIDDETGKGELENKEEKTPELSSEEKDENEDPTKEQKDGDVEVSTDKNDVGDDNTKQSIEEELANAMDDISVDENEKTEEYEEILPNEEPYVLKSIKLSVTMATGVIRSIVKVLLPKLQQTITLNKKSSVHKVNRKKTALEQEEEDTMCIPVALAIVKLLQRLPSRYLDQHLPGVFLNICAYLKSRLESVRRVAREMLQKIMESLGPQYLSILFNEMISLLTKGFQKHVLIFTIHSVISSMKLAFKTGDMDGCLSQILHIVKIDLFGEAFEEKGVTQITGKVVEARSHKSYNTLYLAAQHISEKCFIDLLLPFKEVLATTHSFSTLVRVSESLGQIVKGLNDNVFVSVESLLIFIYGVVSGSIAVFKMNNEQKVNKEETKQTLLKQPDTFLIPKAPRTRYGTLTAKPNLSSDRNAHMLVEFGFRLLHILLKRGKAVSDEFLKYIDPLVPILQNNIDAKHVKLTTITLQCFVNIFKMDLPSLKKIIDTLADSLFSLLHKYATAGLSQGEYLDMVVAAYKAVTVLVGHVKYHLINDIQLKSLLLYIEQGMQDFTQQATAFPLLKAILSRKPDIPEIYEIMSKVAQISVICEHDHVRAQARQVFYHFLMNYPLGSKIETHVNFYISQLSYELEPGRLSAFQIIHRMIATFPDHALSKYAGVLFVGIGAALVNDERASCKKMAAKCLKILIEKDETDRDRLFNMSFLWMKDQKIGHRCLGAQICGIFVEVETEKFLRRLEELLPVIQTQLTARMNLLYAPGKCVRLAQEQNESEEVKEKKLRLEDHCIFQVLQLIKKICSLCPAFLKDEVWMSHVENIAEAAQSLLSHPHQWIRLEASAVLGFVFASLDIKALVQAVSSSSFIEGRYLFHDTGNKLKSLVLDFCDQLIPNSESPHLIEQVTKNLAFLCRVIRELPEDVELPKDDGFKISLLWLIRRMRKIVNMEIVTCPSSYILREAVFKWIGALVVDLTKEQLLLVISQVLAPLAREILLEDDTHPELLRLAKGVAKIIKKKIGEEEYSNQLSKLQMRISTKRAMRKNERAKEVVNNPVVAAKRKIKKQQKKKIMKKRKMDEWKGRVAPRKKRKSNNNYNSENSVPKKKWVVTVSASDA